MIALGKMQLKRYNIYKSNFYLFTFNRIIEVIVYIFVWQAIYYQTGNAGGFTIAEMIKTNLAEIGIPVTIVKASDNQYQNYLQNKNYDVILTGITESMSPNLETFFGESNLSNYKNEEITTISGYVGNINPGEVLKLDTQATFDFSNAYDVQITIKDSKN